MTVLRWTREVPTVPGWYWVRGGNYSDAVHDLVIGSAGVWSSWFKTYIGPGFLMEIRYRYEYDVKEETA